MVVSLNAEMQWKTPQDLAAENYMMHLGPSTYNPYWNGMQPGMGMDGYMPPYGAPMPYMGYGMGPMDMPFGGPFPPDSFGGQGYMMPMVPPQRYMSFSILSHTLFVLALSQWMSLWCSWVCVENSLPFFFFSFSLFVWSFVVVNNIVLRSFP